ncbi:hydroxymethylglutaryl-CoA synthase [Streptococcus porcinus]|uniref:3-hydroxy-3-methylglutaryl-CoA synthase n=1 Tax=Streptococcus porcinus TaxID=1340 RepID=A0A4V0HAX7_STRPO|nr:hydroxymethylglutaryl-CoA synthase [Streptococcus porcinus]VTT44250.1 3-hydroxy-3-methylglutaryl-CoA synthase [Streptococcus porcinus]VTT45486.1 3-hydroxy-3-methylglutaryl-CoA synthase [Streptococcus porcinus]
MKIGIDKIGFATGRYVLNMDQLAIARQTDPDKFTKGLMLDRISITPISEDIVTLAATAADTILDQKDKESIDMVILATESSIDQSKAASVYVHHLLGIQPFARSIEIKEACYSATAALDYAKAHITLNPDSRVLVIASDIAKYGIKSAGEPTQGAGSVAILVKANPSIAIINNDNVAQTRDVMDFWRPNYSSTPYVNGIFSTKQYLDSLKTTWKEYQNRQNLEVTDFTAFCFHIPFPKLAFKGLNKLFDKETPDSHKKQLNLAFEASIAYSRQVGNIYTGSLYMSLLSLLENCHTLQAGDKIGMFSYGSGAVSEIYSIQLVDGYQSRLETNRQAYLDQRQEINVTDYETIFYADSSVDQEGNLTFDDYLTGTFALKSIQEHQRIYEKNDK